MQSLLAQYVPPVIDVPEAIYPRDREKLIAWDRTDSGRIITLTVLDEVKNNYFRYPWGRVMYPAKYSLYMRKNGRLVFYILNISRRGPVPPSLLSWLGDIKHAKLVQEWGEYHW